MDHEQAVELALTVDAVYRTARETLGSTRSGRAARFQPRARFPRTEEVKDIVHSSQRPQ